MRIHHFWAQNGPFAHKRFFFFSEKLLISLAPFIHAYQHGKNQVRYQSINEILMIKEY